MRVAGLLRASYERDLGDVAAFLPNRVPLDELPGPFERYLSACAELPARYPVESGGVRRWLEREFPRDDPVAHRAIAGLSAGESETVMTALSALCHTYRWDCVPPAKERFEEQRIALPPGLSAPWTELARALDQPRVGNTWSMHLCNWKMLDRAGGAAYRPEELTAETVGVARNWLLPPIDAQLERFSVSFVLLEARGAVVLRHAVDAVEAAAHRRLDDTVMSLKSLHQAIHAMTLAFSLNVRTRLIDPTIWLEMVQPTFAWSADADEPGCVEGGPSGMQLATIQALDAALGIGGESTLARLAKGGRRGMPTPHRRFLQRLDLGGPVLRGFVLGARCRDLSEQYNRCIRGVTGFRTTHLSRGALYLRNGPEDGTGRASTGLTIGVGDEPLAIFERTMSERTLETRAAMLPPDTATLSQIP